MRGNKRLFLLLGALCVVNLLAHLCFYPALPEMVPIHWGFDGRVNGWGPKWNVLILAALPAAMLALLYFLPHMDPKRESYQKFAPIWRGFAIALTLFLAAFSWLIELAAFGVLPESGNLVGVLVSGGVGVLFIFLGNYMPRIKQNYFFGCRTPWALADEHNWNRTQRMGGISFVISGAVLILLGLLSPLLGEGWTVGLLLAVTLGDALWTFLYSFLVFKKILK